MSEHIEAMSRTLALARDLMRGGDVSDGELASAFTGLTVAIVADEANVSSFPGQCAATTLYSMVARLGCPVSLALPDVQLCSPQPPLRGNGLRSALEDLGRDLIPGYQSGADDTRAALTFVLGDTPWESDSRAWRLSASPWAGNICPVREPAEQLSGEFPMGAMAAGALAAAEPFKAALRRLPEAYGIPVDPDFTREVPKATFELAPMGTAATAVDLGHIDLISGGAITNAVLYCLLRVPGLIAQFRVIEPETLDLSNLNRYFLARRAHVGESKVDILTSYTTPMVTIEGVKHRFDAEADLRLAPLAAHAIVGADDIPARWQAQEHYGKWLGIGATSHFLTLTSSHEPGEGCAGCLHPRDEPGPAILPTAPFVSFWAGLLMAVRLIRYSVGQPHPRNEQAIQFTPLLPDEPHARIAGSVPINPQCPVGCSRPQGGAARN